MRMKPSLLATLALLAFAAPPAPAQPAKPKATETQVDGVTAEISEAVRKEGVLTVKMRLRNTGTTLAKVKIASDFTDADKYYAVAGSTKYLVLKDTKGAPLMVQFGYYGALVADINPGGSFLFWAKYPAPGNDARKFTFFTPLTAPIEDVPITDAQ